MPICIVYTRAVISTQHNYNFLYLEFLYRIYNKLHTYHKTPAPPVVLVTCTVLFRFMYTMNRLDKSNSHE